jgi:hypothetical protein
MIEPSHRVAAQEAQPVRLLEMERIACADREQGKRDFNDEHVVVVVDDIHVPVSRALDWLRLGVP